MFGVHDLGVILHAIEATLGVFECGDRCVGGRRRHGKTLGHLGDCIEVTHPHRLRSRSVGEHLSRMRLDREFGASVFAAFVSPNDAILLMGDHLRAVANAEHRNVEVVHGWIDHRGAIDVH